MATQMTEADKAEEKQVKELIDAFFALDPTAISWVTDIILDKAAESILHYEDKITRIEAGEPGDRLFDLKMKLRGHVRELEFVSDAQWRLKIWRDIAKVMKLASDLESYWSCVQMVKAIKEDQARRSKANAE